MKDQRDQAAVALELGRLALRFGRVNRATFHEDGERPETDTDHTVMLGLVACALAPAHLDKGLVAQFVLVHDLPEAYAGDTNTAFITPEGRQAKQEREDRAVERLNGEFGEDAPWLTYYLWEYERQMLPEARYVRYMDKAMPKITHALNGCATVKGMERTRQDVELAHQAQLDKLTAEYPVISRYMAPLMCELMKVAEGSF
jgi:5'-deoxynucleotidase YfbR-like HD superfamily hydrolase